MSIIEGYLARITQRTERKKFAKDTRKGKSLPKIPGKEKPPFDYTRILYPIIWILIASGAAALGIFMLTGQKEKLDESLCPESGTISETVILIDTGEQLSPKYQSELTRLIGGFMDSNSEIYIPTGGRITAYHLSDVIDITNSEGVIVEERITVDPIVSVCNPGTNPDDRNWVDDLTSGQRFALEKWGQFNNGLDLLFPNQPDVEHNKSPILETIAIIIARHTGFLQENKVKELHLVIWSDMLQNTNKMSHFKEYPNPNQFLNSVAYANLKTDLSGTDITIFYLGSPKYSHRQGENHALWWRSVLSGLGSQPVWQGPI